MADLLSREQRSWLMSHIHSKGTKPEIIFRHALWHLGFRFIVNDKRLPGKPDIVLPKYRTVVFIHGCFWHAHQGCNTFKMPQSNTDYWRRKIARNHERDQQVWRKIEAQGWAVIIVWECQLKKGTVDETVERVAAEIVGNGAAYRAAQEERKISRENYRKEQKARKEKERVLIREITGK